MDNLISFLIKGTEKTFQETDSMVLTIDFSIVK